MSSIHTYSINKSNYFQPVEHIPCNSFVLYMGEICVFVNSEKSKTVKLFSIESFISHNVEWGTKLEVLPPGTKIEIMVGKNPY